MISHAKPISLVLAFVVLFGGWRAPLMAQARAYAVQVAALQSQESAEVLVHGLRARGLEAYWVRANIPGQGVLYRVRLGKFASLSQARAYAEQLLKSGLIDQYSIPTYDLPTKVVTSLPQPVMAVASTPDQSKPISAGSSPASPPVSSPTSSASLGQAERETIILIASRQWAAPAPLASLTAAPPATKPSQSPPTKNTPPATPLGASPNGSSSATNASLVAPPLATSSSSSSSPLSSSSGGSSSAASAPPPSAIGTAVSLPPPGVSPTVSRPASSSAAPPVSVGAGEKLPAPGGVAPELGPPLLYGVVESRNGQLQLVVQNLDARQPFKGRATVTIDDGKRQNEAAPVPLALRPDEELTFPLNAPMVNGNYTMVIYDERGAVRIIRGAPIGTGLPQSKTAGPTPPPPALLPQNDISLVPRQIAATSENITLEFEITSQRPLGYITLTLRVGSAYTQPQRAVLTATQGRIPFLVPTRLPESAFTYELKDDSERVLLTGEDDLRRLVKE